MTDGARDGHSLRVLHLAFEDYRRPGSGGGGLRTHEVNTRLACNHQITCVVARYPGARTRIEDGITYRPLGLALGHIGSLITYHLALPWYVLGHPADVVIEDFSAPHSSNLVPLWTRSPTVAIVQFLFAGQKSKQYGLPLWAFEDTGVRLHQRFVLVSQYLARRIHDVNPEAVVEVVYAGVKPLEIRHPSPPRRDILVLGRIEYHMKGLDLLVEAFGEVSRDWPDARLRIAGDGQDQELLRQLLVRRGLDKKVDWLGRVSGQAKWDALRQAAILLMPSRFETFGQVVLEAMAVGTPVVGFALPSLEEIIAGTCGAVLVEPENGVALGRAASVLLGDPVRRRRMSEAALKRAADFDWEQAARAQERFYLEAVAEGRDGSRRARLRLLWRALRQMDHGRARSGSSIPSYEEAWRPAAPEAPRRGWRGRRATEGGELR
jgi:glycogen(starch) synthase